MLTADRVWSDVQNGNYEIFFERSTDNGVTWTNPGATPTPTNTATPTPTNTATPTATNAPTATATATSAPAATWTPIATPTSVSTGSGVTKYYYFGSLRVAMNVGGTVYYLHADHLGSTRIMGWGTNLVHPPRARPIILPDSCSPVKEQSRLWAPDEPYGSVEQRAAPQA